MCIWGDGFAILRSEVPFEDDASKGGGGGIIDTNGFILGPEVAGSVDDRGRITSGSAGGRLFSIPK